jgi:hypothetical protein
MYRLPTPFVSAQRLSERTVFSTQLLQFSILTYKNVYQFARPSRKRQITVTVKGHATQELGVSSTVIDVTILAPTIWTWLTGFWKTSDPCPTLECCTS